jgi:HK97 family phage prohead protease
MTRKLLTVDEFRSGAKDGARPEGTVIRLAVADPLAATDGSRKIRFVFSDGSVDRAGDSIDPAGWDIASFLKNPVALWAHDSYSPPIGRASNVGPAGGKLMGDIEFMPPEISAFADSVYRMVQGGYVKAVSVGFIPLEYSFVNEQDRPFGIDFKRQELLEISVCPVPCNPNALQEARAKGIDTAPLREWAERMLDGGGHILVPRDLLVETFKAAKTPHTVRQKYLAVAKAADWNCGAARDLPLDQDEAWDGPTAEASIFDHAGGDDFNPEVARKGFLAYDAGAPKLRGSYKLPFAHVVGGALKAAKGGIRAAASRLPQAEIGDSARSEAQGVVDHYETAFGIKAKAESEATDGALVPDGNCGRAKDVPCGMIDQQECAVHYVAPAPKAKAGRRISAANAALLQKAMDHHAAATQCIKDVLDSNEPDGDEEPDPSDDPEKQRAERLRRARALKDSLKQD